MKLRVKLILSYLAIVFLNAGLIMTMAIRSSSRTVADAVSSDLRHVAMGAAEQINLMMAKLIHVAEVTSRSTVLGVTDAKLKGSYLRETLERNPEWNTISEFDFQGNVSASTEASTGGKSFRELYPESTEFFEKAKKLKQGEFLFRDAYLPIGETTPRFLILVPVYSSAASGAPSVLVFESILHAIKERVFNLDEKTPGGYPAYLVNREGAVLATQDKTAIPLKPLPEVKSHQNLANAISSDENGSLRLRNSKGDDVIIAYADVDQWGANTSGDWAVLTIASEKHVLAPVIRLRHTLIATSVLVCVIACLLGVYVAGRIDQPVQSLIRKTTEIAHTGDLTQKIELKSNGEMGLLGRAFDTMLESLRKLISQVVNAGFQITSATTQLRSSAAQQASGAVKQSSTTSQLIATVEELAQSAAQIAVSAEQLSRNADVTAKSIEAIHERVAETARRVLDLGQKSEGIGVITTAIDDLADQTHLLALNAAIEAARAGESGRGFAVIASEVRKLAERSFGSTAEIRTLIEEIQKETSAVVIEVEDATKAAARGLEQTGETVAAIKGISFATQQQRSASQQIIQALRDVDQTAQEFSASTKQIASASEQLSRLAGELQTSIGKFNVNAEAKG